MTTAPAPATVTVTAPVTAAAAPSTVPRYDRNADPKKLAKWGRLITRKLNGNPYVQHVDVPGAQVYVYQNFLSPADCQLLCDRIDAEAVPSTLYKGTEIDGFRTSFSCHMNAQDPDIDRIDRRIADVLGVDFIFSETMQGQRYRVGEQFKGHYDYFHLDQEYWVHEGPHGGQRSWTAMIYLNEPAAGGATEFPHLQIGVKPQLGMMLMWNNMTLDGHQNLNTLHAGTPVTEGTKYIITKWFRQNSWQTINGVSRA